MNRLNRFPGFLSCHYPALRWRTLTGLKDLIMQRVSSGFMNEATHSWVLANRMRHDGNAGSAMQAAMRRLLLDVYEY